MVNNRNLEKLIGYITAYRNKTLSCNSEYAEDIISLCQTVTIKDIEYKDSYLDILRFIMEDSYKFGVNPIFMGNNTLYSNFLSLYKELPVGERVEFSKTVMDISYEPSTNRNLESIEDCLRIAIDSEDYDLIGWLIPDWYDFLYGETCPMTYTAAVMVCEILKTDVNICDYDNKELGMAYWYVFSFDLSEKEWNYFVSMMDEVINRCHNYLSLDSTIVNQIMKRLENHGLFKGVNYLRKYIK